MRKLLASFALVVSLPALLTSQRTQSPELKYLALMDVTVIDTAGGPPKPDMTVVIAGDRIGLLDVSGKLTPPDDFGAQEYSFAGFRLYDELKVFVQAGMTPLEALQTATLHPARYLGMIDAFGTWNRAKLPISCCSTAILSTTSAILVRLLALS